MRLAAGSTLGPYQITGPIGAGGMGEVYRARDTRLGREVAIKVLPLHLSTNPHLRERFNREARAISTLTHAHICTLYDVGRVDGIDFLVMEFLEGQTLAERITKGPVPLKDVLRYGAEIASALDKAHQQGIVHRDLKPGNVMITKSGAKVLDFGLAKYTASDSLLNAHQSSLPTEHKSLTQEGTFLGTVQYMAPEQLEGKEADGRTDIFALGAVLYEMATGRCAFEGDSKASLIASIIQSEPPAVRAIEPRTPRALEHVIGRCLSKDPADRFQNARDLQFALQEVEEHSAPPERKSFRKMLYVAGAVGVLLFLTTIMLVMMEGRSGSSPGSGSQKVVAVLPLANLGVDPSRDYLRLAIPDEITTILSYSRALAVRPFTITRRISAELDPQQVAKELGAGRIITGHLMSEGDRLLVTLEAIDVAENKLLWRDVIGVPSNDVLGMRRQLSEMIRAGLLPRLEAGSGAPEPAGPKSAAGYALYLRAAALSSDADPNKEALRMLEEAVRLDPTFAPAWSALSRRYYYDFNFSDGGNAAFTRAQAAVTRALELDPDLADAALRLITMRVERGETVQAFREAKDLVARRPESSEAHGTLAYVLRYPGLLEESARECNAA